MQIDERINEVKIKNSEIKQIDLNLVQVCKSICKISSNQKMAFLLNYIQMIKNYFV